MNHRSMTYHGRYWRYWNSNGKLSGKRVLRVLSGLDVRVRRIASNWPAYLSSGPIESDIDPKPGIDQSYRAAKRRDKLSAPIRPNLRLDRRIGAF